MKSESLKQLKLFCIIALSMVIGAVTIGGSNIKEVYRRTIGMPTLMLEDAKGGFVLIYARLTGSNKEIKVDRGYGKSLDTSRILNSSLGRYCRVVSMPDPTWENQIYLETYIIYKATCLNGEAYVGDNLFFKDEAAQFFQVEHIRSDDLKCDVKDLVAHSRGAYSNPLSGDSGLKFLIKERNKVLETKKGKFEVIKTAYIYGNNNKNLEMRYASYSKDCKSALSFIIHHPQPLLSEDEEILRKFSQEYIENPDMHKEIDVGYHFAYKAL